MQLSSSDLEMIFSYAEIIDPLQSKIAPVSSPQFRRNWVLLMGNCYQDIPLNLLKIIGDTLWNHFGTTLFEFPLVSRREILACIDTQTFAKSWQLRDYLPGIIWRISELSAAEKFQFLNEKNLSMQKADSWLRQHLFFIGKQNVYSSKLRLILHLLSLPEPLGTGLTLRGNAIPPYFEWNHERGLGQFYNSKKVEIISSKKPELRITKLKELARLIDSQRPWLLTHWHLHRVCS